MMVVSVLQTHSSPAIADDHYSSHVIANDLGAALTIAGAVRLGEPRVLWASGAIYVAGAPIIHLAHDNPRSALYSLGLRSGLGLASWGMLRLCEDEKGFREDFRCILLGLTVSGLGIVLVSTVDAIVLAQTKSASSSASQLSWGWSF